MRRYADVLTIRSSKIKATNQSAGGRLTQCIPPDGPAYTLAGSLRDALLANKHLAADASCGT